MSRSRPYDALLDRDIAAAAHNRLAFEAELLGLNSVADYLRMHARVVGELAVQIDAKTQEGPQR